MSDYNLSSLDGGVNIPLTTNVDQLPSYDVNVDGGGTPQAPWWQSVLNTAGRIGEGFAGAAIIDQYQRSGIQYQGPTPYINGGTVRGNGQYPYAPAATQDSTMMMLLLVGLAFVMFRGA